MPSIEEIVYAARDEPLLRLGFVVAWLEAGVGMADTRQRVLRTDMWLRQRFATLAGFPRSFTMSTGALLSTPEGIAEVMGPEGTSPKKLWADVSAGLEQLLRRVAEGTLTPNEAHQTIELLRGICLHMTPGESCDDATTRSLAQQFAEIEERLPPRLPGQDCTAEADEQEPLSESILALLKEAWELSVMRLGMVTVFLSGATRRDDARDRCDRADLFLRVSMSDLPDFPRTFCQTTGILLTRAKARELVMGSFEATEPTQLWNDLRIGLDELVVLVEDGALSREGGHMVVDLLRGLIRELTDDGATAHDATEEVVVRFESALAGAESKLGIRVS